MLRIVLAIFQVFFAFHAISNIKKRLVWEKKFQGGGGGGGVSRIFFFYKTILSHYAIFNIKKKKLPLHLLVKWEVVSPNSRLGTVGIYIQYILYSLVLIFLSQIWGGGCFSCILCYFQHF